MDRFQQDVIDRLARLEEKLDGVEKWIEHRKITLPKVVGVCAIVFGTIKGLEILGQAAGWW